MKDIDNVCYGSPSKASRFEERVAYSSTIINNTNRRFNEYAVNYFSLQPTPLVPEYRSDGTSYLTGYEFFCRRD